MKAFTKNSAVASEQLPHPELRQRSDASAPGRQRRSPDARAALQRPAGSAGTDASLHSVAGRALERPTVLLYKAGESYASRSPHPLRRTVVNTELAPDLL